MRTLHIAVGGGVVFIIMFGLSRAIGGTFGALGVFLAITVAILTAGLTAAAAHSSWQNRGKGPVGTPSCSECHRPLIRVGYYRVCPSCDQIVVGN
jgi:hypothetical protein